MGESVRWRLSVWSVYGSLVERYEGATRKAVMRAYDRATRAVRGRFVGCSRVLTGPGGEREEW